MNVICFIPSSEQLQRLNSTVLASLPEDVRFEVHRTLRSVNLRMRRDIQWDSVIILCPKTMEHLQHFISFREYICRARIILLLPSSANGMADSIHLLSPSFIMYADQDLHSICEVVEKIHNYFQQSRFGNFYKENYKWTT